MIHLTFLIAVAISQPHGADRSSLAISGDGMKSMQLSIADLQKLKHAKVSVHEPDGTDSTYEGAQLIELLKSAGFTVADHPGKAMSAYVAVSASDGYQVVFGLGELMPSISGRTAIMAYSMNGKPLSEGVGPFRVLVDGDKIQSRAIRNVTELKLVQLRK